MARQAIDRLKDIAGAISDIHAFTDGMTKAVFLASPTKNRKTFRAVIGCLMEVGEAVKNLPKEVTDRHPGIPWRAIGGMRDRIAHEYFLVDAEIVWETIRDGDLDALQAAVTSEIGRLSS